MLEIDNQRLYNENDQLKRPILHEKLSNSLQSSNVIILNSIHIF